MGLSAGLNLYGYVEGDPINAIDPSGFASSYDKWVRLFGKEKADEMLAKMNGAGSAASTPAVEPAPVVEASPAVEVSTTESTSLPEVLRNRPWLKNTPKSVTQGFLDEVAKKRAQYAGINPNLHNCGELDPDVILPNTAEKGLVSVTEDFALDVAPNSGRGLAQRIIQGAGKKGVGAYQTSIASKGGGAAFSTGGLILEGGVYLYVGYQIFDWDMNQGNVYDSFDNSWKPWSQYKQEHIYNNIPPSVKKAWAAGDKWRAEFNEFQTDILFYGPVGPGKYAGDLARRRIGAYFGNLKKKPSNR
jgi:hypothetical protein